MKTFKEFAGIATNEITKSVVPFQGDDNGFYEHNKNRIGKTIAGADDFEVKGSLVMACDKMLTKYALKDQDGYVIFQISAASKDTETYSISSAELKLLKKLK